MVSDQEFCIVHGYTVEFDYRSGFHVCRECERESQEKDSAPTSKWPEGAEL